MRLIKSTLPDYLADKLHWTEEKYLEALERAVDMVPMSNTRSPETDDFRFETVNPRKAQYLRK